MLEIQIRNKDGELRKVNDFRRRTRIAPGFLLIGKVLQEELLRLDLLANRIYSDPYAVGTLIDSNDKDLFSLEVNEDINYLNPEFR
jgi:hypothetical protein